MNISDMNVPFMLASLAFVVICLVFAAMLIHLRRVSYRREMIRKIREDEAGWSGIETDGSSLKLNNRSGNAFVNFLNVIGLKITPGKSSGDSQARIKFLRAGLHGRNVVSVFWGSKIFLVATLPIVFLILVAVFPKPLNSSYIPFAVAFMGMLGLILPDIWLRVKTKERMNRVVRGFPDALDLLVVCVEAGMGLDAAINRVGEELGLTHQELSEELKLVNLELRAGKARHSALKNLAERTGIEDVNSLVTLLIQTDMFGTSIAQALRVYSDSFRTARFQRAEEIAAKISTKLIFPLVLFIFPCLFVILLGPVAIQVYRVVLH